MISNLHWWLSPESWIKTTEWRQFCIHLKMSSHWIRLTLRWSRFIPLYLSNTLKLSRLLNIRLFKYQRYLKNEFIFLHISWQKCQSLIFVVVVVVVFNFRIECFIWTCRSSFDIHISSRVVWGQRHDSFVKEGYSVLNGARMERQVPLNDRAKLLVWAVAQCDLRV